MPATASSRAGLAALLAWAAWCGRGVWFFIDEWAVITRYHDGHWLTPFNGHLSIVPIGVYRAAARDCRLRLRAVPRPSACCATARYAIAVFVLRTVTRRSRRWPRIAALLVAWSSQSQLLAHVPVAVELHHPGRGAGRRSGSCSSATASRPTSPPRPARGRAGDFVGVGCSSRFTCSWSSSCGVNVVCVVGCRSHRRSCCGACGTSRTARVTPVPAAPSARSSSFGYHEFLATFVALAAGWKLGGVAVFVGDRGDRRPGGHHPLEDVRPASDGNRDHAGCVPRAHRRRAQRGGRGVSRAAGRSRLRALRVDRRPARDLPRRVCLRGRRVRVPGISRAWSCSSATPQCSAATARLPHCAHRKRPQRAHGFRRDRRPRRSGRPGADRCRSASSPYRRATTSPRSRTITARPQQVSRSPTSATTRRGGSPTSGSSRTWVCISSRPATGRRAGRGPTRTRPKARDPGAGDAPDHRRVVRRGCASPAARAHLRASPRGEVAPDTTSELRLPADNSRWPWFVRVDQGARSKPGA